jgi:hypothetical protein
VAKPTFGQSVSLRIDIELGAYWTPSGGQGRLYKADERDAAG